MSFSLATLPGSHNYPQPSYATTTATLTTHHHCSRRCDLASLKHCLHPSRRPTRHLLFQPPPKGKEYPLGLPFLVLTHLDATVFDPGRRSVIMTATTIQVIPDAPTVTEAGSANAYEIHGWSDWTFNEVGGMIAAIVITTVVTLVSLGWCAKRRRVWRRRGETNGMRKGGREWWRADEHDSNKDVSGAEMKLAKKRMRRRGDDEESPFGRRSSQEMRAGGSKDTGARLGVVRTARSDEAQFEAVQGLSPAMEVYQVSGARQRTPSPVLKLQGQLGPGNQTTQREFLAPQPNSEGSCGTMSAYRAMRMQERRQERAMPCAQIPALQHPQSI
ncbi:MAG: hypothetical protein Q9196_007224 [Gyalolechia fulgens]